jgi:hypothetical protein
MAEKKNFVLRLSPEMYAALEKWAADDFRSVNGQVEWLLDRALKDAGRKPRILEREGGTENERTPNEKAKA